MGGHFQAPAAGAASEMHRGQGLRAPWGSWGGAHRPRDCPSCQELLGSGAAFEGPHCQPEH